MPYHEHAAVTAERWERLLAGETSDRALLGLRVAICGLGPRGVVRPQAGCAFGEGEVKASVGVWCHLPKLAAEQDHLVRDRGDVAQPDLAAHMLARAYRVSAAPAIQRGESRPAFDAGDRALCRANIDATPTFRRQWLMSAG
jgi:hypothetical protein